MNARERRKQDLAWQQLLESFFTDFIHRIHPHLAARLDLLHPEFPDRESYLEGFSWHRREPRLLVRVPILPGGRDPEPGVLLLHIVASPDLTPERGEFLKPWLGYLQDHLEDRHDGPVLQAVFHPRRSGLPGGRWTVHGRWER